MVSDQKFDKTINSQFSNFGNIQRDSNTSFNTINNPNLFYQKNFSQNPPITMNINSSNKTGNVYAQNKIKNYKNKKTNMPLNSNFNQNNMMMKNQILTNNNMYNNNIHFNQNNFQNFSQNPNNNNNYVNTSQYLNNQQNFLQQKIVNSKFSPTNINQNNLPQTKNNSTIVNNIFNTTNNNVITNRIEDTSSKIENSSKISNYEKDSTNPVIKNLPLNNNIAHNNTPNQFIFGQNHQNQFNNPMPIPPNQNNYINFQHFNLYNQSLNPTFRPNFSNEYAYNQKANLLMQNSKFPMNVNQSLPTGNVNFVNYYNNMNNYIKPNQNYAHKSTNSSNSLKSNQNQIVNQTQIINNINIINNKKISIQNYNNNTNQIQPNLVEKTTKNQSKTNINLANLNFPKDNIQEIINQTINKNYVNQNPIIRKYSEEIISNFDNQNDFMTNKSSKNITLKIAIKLKGNLNKFIEISESEDAYEIVKKFCAENELSDNLILPILSKINISFEHFNDINNNELNDEIEMVLKEALYFYNDHEKIESLLNEKIFSNSFDDSLDELEIKKKRGCSV